MTTYKVEVGHDVALLSLNEIEPQPRSQGIKPSRRTYSASGTATDEGLHIELEFTALSNAAEYQALLNMFGVKPLTTGPVTVYVQNQYFEWVRMNGTAVQPEQGRDANRNRYFIRDVTILVKDLEAAA